MYGIAHTACSGSCILQWLSDPVDRCRMKAAVILSVPITTSTDVCWRWRALDGKADSIQAFIDYYACLENAQAHGYHVQATPRRADASPSMRPAQARGRSCTTKADFT